LLRAANKLETGDYAEFGVHFGLMLKVIHCYMDSTRTLYGFDTFNGFDGRDIDAEEQVNAFKWRGRGFHPTSIDGVFRFIGGDKPVENLRLVGGWFPESFRGFEHLRFRFAHVDMDLAQPTQRALELLWPRMVPGGIVALHDYGCPSLVVQKVVDEFCASVGTLPVPLADWCGTAVVRKPL